MWRFFERQHGAVLVSCLGSLHKLSSTPPPRAPPTPPPRSPRSYVFPKGNAEWRLRVAAAMGLLLGSKLLTVQVGSDSGHPDRAGVVSRLACNPFPL